MSGLLALASRTHEAVSFRHCESQLSLDPSSAAQWVTPLTRHVLYASGTVPYATARCGPTQATQLQAILTADYVTGSCRDGKAWAAAQWPESFFIIVCHNKRLQGHYLPLWGVYTGSSEMTGQAPKSWDPPGLDPEDTCTNGRSM